MNGWKQYLLVTAFAVAPVFAQPAPFPQVPQTPQIPQVPPFPAFDLDLKMAEVRAKAQELSSGMLFFQGKVGTIGRFDADYESGTRALDEHKYEDAVRR